MFQGLRTVIYRIRNEDLQKATKWYSELLGKPPYFNQPFYVGFNVGGYELGLDPGGSNVISGNSGHTYWGVPDIHKSFHRCLELGATQDESTKDVGEGIKVATVRDPFGNILGLIENPGFKLG